jgi:hypothetical protein
VGVAISQRERLDHPLTLHCEDFPLGTCCSGCHEDMEQYFITVYPESAYSVGFSRKMPDFGLGIHAEICCGRYEAVRRLDRSYWLRAYAKNKGWTEAHIKYFCDAPKDKFMKVWDELLSHYWRARGGVTQKASATQKKPVVHKRALSSSKCPKCGSTWNTIVCDNCGNF